MTTKDKIVELDDFLGKKLEDLALIIRSVGDIGIIIAKHMRNLPTCSTALDSSHNHKTPGNNIHGETQTTLDVYANGLFRDCLKKIPCVKAIVSEEDDDITVVNKDADYTLAYDPIDGSSNIDINIPVGSILAVYGPDAKIIASSYIIYGSATLYVLAIDNSVSMFALGDNDKWILSKENILVPSTGIYYSINEGNEKFWSSETKQYIAELKRSGRYSLRYVGSMVSDIHRTLMKGGIFIYPGDYKNPNGKLRQLYEVNPMSYIIESAGGLSYRGGDMIRCLDVPVTDIHQKCPIYIGSRTDVQRAMEIISSPTDRTTL